MFNQFIPDVLRVDTSVTSSYLVPCGTLDSTPLLCGGRFLNDDVIDVTYDYLLNGAANYLTPGDGGPLDQQVIALVSDGVSFSKDPAKNSLDLSKPDPANQQQDSRTSARRSRTARRRSDRRTERSSGRSRAGRRRGVRADRPRRQPLRVGLHGSPRAWYVAGYSCWE